MPFTKRARYCELLKAHAQAPLDVTDLAELRELHRGAAIAGFDVLDELGTELGPQSPTPTGTVEPTAAVSDKDAG